MWLNKNLLNKSESFSCVNEMLNPVSILINKWPTLLMFNCHECHLFEINTLWKIVLPQSTHPSLIQNTRGKSFTFTASWMSCYPQHPGLSRLDRLVQNSHPKIYECYGSVFYWAEILLIRRVYKIKLLCPPPECLVYDELPVSKHPQQKAYKHIYISSQNARFIRSCPPQSE